MRYPEHRSKSKKNCSLKEVKDVILIVYEGKCTEYNYFWGIKKEFRHSNVLLHGPFSDPKTLVLETQKILFQKHGINKVYCVFDHDGRKSFKSALELIVEHNKIHSIKIEPIASNPCFEIWILLHYTFSTKSYPTLSKGKSASNDLIKAICKYFPNYNKNLPTIYQDLNTKTPEAIKNAKKLSAFQKEDCTKNPYTDVHKLVLVLLQSP